MRIVAGILVLASSGCHFMMSGLVAHNSRGSSCIDSPAFAVIDLAIAGIGAAGVAASEESPGYYVLPGLVALSGIGGVVEVARCRSDDDAEAPPTRTVPAGTNEAPPFGEAPVDPALRDATPEERGLGTAPPSPKLQLDIHGIPTELPPRLPTVDPAPTPAPTPDPPAPTCTLTPRKDCPDRYFCQLQRENVGVCVRID